jgi:hypothetical protein
LETCRAALQLQYQRVLDLEKAPRDRTEWRSLEPDCYLLVLALRQALVGIEAVAHFEGGAIEDLVDEATTTMATELSGLKDLRNMLTHFDDYLKGSGVFSGLFRIQISICIENGDTTLIAAKCSFGSGPWEDPLRYLVCPDGS